MSYTNVSVKKVTNNAGRPTAFKNEIIFFDWDDVLTLPARDEKGVKITGNLAMKSGKTAFTIYAIPKTVKAYQTSEGDPDKKGFIQNLEFEHPGDELAISEFLENKINENMGAIVQKADGTGKRIIGTPGCPLQFTHEGQNDSEAITNVLKFSSLLRGPVIAHYEGELPALDTDSSSGSGV
jgi:hypothetical protein